MTRQPTWDIDPKELHRLYVTEGHSTLAIAKQYGLKQKSGNWDAPKVQRALERNQIPVRSKQAAAKLSLETGASVLPTEGKPMDAKTRVKIGTSMVESYKHLSKEEKKKRTKGVRSFWDNKDNKEEQLAVREKIGAQLRYAVQHGTHLERSISKFLIQQGYTVDMHAKGILEDPWLECDMLVRGNGVVVVIEVDGPRHYGKWMNNTPAQLAEIIKTDQKKNGLVLSKPGNVFLLRILYKYGREITYVRAVLEKLHQVLEHIKQASKQKLSAKDRFVALDMSLVIEGKPSTDNTYWRSAMKILRGN